MRKYNSIGFLYFIVHFIIEITSYYVVFSYFKNEYIVMFAFVYDVLAFIPEGFYGFLNDMGLRIHFGYIGFAIAAAALVMCAFEITPIIAIVTVAVGNGMIHVQGAQMTLRGSEGKMFPSALFVSGGAFGVVTGRLMAVNGIPVLPVIVIHVLILFPIIWADKKKKNLKAEPLTEFNYSDENKGRTPVIAIALFVVILRSYMGYVIPTTWNDTSVTMILLFASMGVGKAIGGYLIDIIGMKRTVMISTIGSLPFLLAGNEIMLVSLIGILLFSMTMAVALGLLVSVIKEYPGIAFGLTTIGLFFGAIFAAFIKTGSFLTNCISISAMTLISYVGLRFIVRKDN